MLVIPRRSKTDEGIFWVVFAVAGGLAHASVAPSRHRPVEGPLTPFAGVECK